MENELLVSAKYFLEGYDLNLRDYNISEINDCNELTRLQESSIGLDYKDSGQIEVRIRQLELKQGLDEIKLQVNENDYNKLMKACSIYHNLTFDARDLFKKDIEKVRDKMVRLNKLQLPSINDYTELIKKREGTFYNPEASQQIKERIIEINKNCSDLNLLRRRLSEERAYCRATSHNDQEVKFKILSRIEDLIKICSDFNVLVDISINKSGNNSEFQEKVEKRMQKLLDGKKLLIQSLKKKKENLPNWLKEELLKRAKEIINKK